MIGIAVSRTDSASEAIAERLWRLRDWEPIEPDSVAGAGGGSGGGSTAEGDAVAAAAGDGETEAADDGTETAASGSEANDDPEWAAGTGYRSGAFELRTFEEWHLHLEGVADAFDGRPDLVVFPSRHSGETGKLLTAHFTGNFGPADHGGEDYALAEAAPNAQRAVCSSLREYAPEGYEVGMECTHHGPTDVGAPSMFVEVGSDRPQWDDPEAAGAVARAILDLAGTETRTERVVVGFGGGHYVPRFERIVRETDWAVGHVGADWGLEAMGRPESHRAVIESAFGHSGADLAVVEGTKPDLKRVIEDLGYRVVSETWIRATDGVPRSLVETVETRVDPVAEGTRFGERARGYRGEIRVETVPEELIGEVQRVDPDAALEAIERETVAYETTQNGTRAGTTVAFRAGEDRERLLDPLVSILAGEYDELERDGDALVVRETEFDPSLAATLGVPEGPAFGRLADGEAVTVDGERIEPEVVHEERTRTIPLR